MSPKPSVTITTKIPSSGCSSLFALLFFTPFLALGIVVAVVSFRPVLDHALSYLWLRAPCVITSSDVETGRSDEGFQTYWFSVRYQYELNGSTYTGTKYRLGYDGSSDYTASLRLARAFLPGQSTECRVDPGDHHRAVLRPGPLIKIGLLLIPLVFTLVGAGGMAVSVLTLRRRRQKASLALTSDAGKGKRSAKLGAIAGLLILTGAGFGVFAGVFFQPLVQFADAGNWTTVPCQILFSEVEQHIGDESSTYAVHILYEYEHDGERYRSNRYSFFGGSSSGKQAKLNIIGRFPSGSNAVCYVNPEDPYTAVLDRSWQPSLLIALLPIAFAICGVAGLAAMARRARRAANGSPGIYARRLADHRQAADVWPIPGANNDVLELKPAASPVAKFLGWLTFAGIWNGVVSVFVMLVVKQVRHGEVSWLLIVFLLPFVLGGIGLAVTAVKALLALFNPRIRLRLSPAEFALGQPGRLEWEFSGDSSKIARLHIALTGKEHVRYTRGTDTVTADNVFVRIPLVDCDDPLLLPRGEVNIEVPAGLMHSFSAPNNKIIWQLSVSGEIPRWPDLNVEFEIEIKPQPVPWRMP